MKVSGKIIKLMVTAGLFTRKVTFTKANGRMTWQMAMASTRASLATTIKESGKTIRGTNTEKKSGQMARSTSANTIMEQNMGSVKYPGMTRTHTKATLSIIILRVRVNISGQTKGSIMDFGSTTRWKAKVSLPGLMVVAIKVSSRTI